MRLHTLSISLGAATATVALEPAAAPRTCEALQALLPVTTTAHYAKIAGHEFYLHLPLFLEAEERRRVVDLSEGTVAFWPERQLLCVYYGRIQEEDAAVTRLGRVAENLAGLAQAAEAMRMKLGESVAYVRLFDPETQAAAPVPARPAAAHSDLARRLLSAYAAMQDAPPADVSAVLAARGVMQPAGRLLAGEAEARKLHEVAWLVREEFLRSGSIADLAPSLLRHFAQRLFGWYGLPGAGALVADAAAELPGLRGPAAAEVLEGLILFIGRLSLWLDASIPWEGINAMMQRASPDPRLVGGAT